MAMVHPSRMALVPQEPQERARRRSLSPHRHRDRERDRDRGRSRSRDRRRSPGRDRERRSSPEYGDYKRSELPPWKRPEHMYTDRRGGNSDLESRRQQRDSTAYNIWPPSPKFPTRSVSPHRRKSKKSKRSYSTSSSSDSSSEEERRRREKKERKRARREKKEKRKRHRSEEENGHRSRSPSRQRSKSKSLYAPDEEDEWVVKSSTNVLATAGPSYQSDDAEGDDLGPQPAIKPNTSKKVDERSYGGALLRGEGSAMAAFLREGTESRIPRRGEIGLTSNEIAAYESVGYVMSGSRHQRMNAVRMRKENQVISAEEKRGILKLQKDERERREAILREEFSELVKDRLRGSDTASSSTK